MKDRGTDTATILYGADGYVFHTSSNLFGYTGMQGYYGDGEYDPEW
jgi:alpha-L-fucosidase 2